MLFMTYTVATIAQIHPLGKTLEQSLDLLRGGNPKEAFVLWNEESCAYKTDSLFVWASSYLAQDFMNLGLYSESELLLLDAEQALDSFEGNSDWWFEQYGYISIKKAHLYGSMHDYVRARTCAANAKIAFEFISKRGIDYALALMICSETALATGDQVMARIFAGEALAHSLWAYQTTGQEENYQIFTHVTRETGLILSELGYYQKAVQLLEGVKAVNMEQNNVDPYIDFSLGYAYVRNGDYEKAVSLLSTFYQNCDILEMKIKGGISLLFAQYKMGLTNYTQLAFDLARLQANNISRMFSFMSDREKEKWWMSNENLLISVADEILLRLGEKGINGIIANNEIFSKGLLLRSSNMLRNAAIGSKDARIAESYYSLERLKGKLSETSDLTKQRALEQEISALEKDLQRKLNISVEEVSSWSDVASSLSNKEIAVEFVRFGYLNETDDAEYYAIIIKKGIKEPIIVRLFDESSLKIILGTQGNKRIDRYITELYSVGAPQYRGKELYNLIWSAIEKEIKGYNTVYYSPAGLLNSISLQAISNGKQCLGQKYVMHQVSSIGEIPHLKKASAAIGNRAVIYGGISYDAEEAELIRSASSYTRGDPHSWDTGSIDVRAGWKRLPGTETEAKEIGSILSSQGYMVETISGIEANEESFKALSGKEINTLHIATHGFFLSEHEDIKKNAFLNPTMSENVGRINPMLRSGLLFAGANRAWTGKRSIEGIDDGILTAKEIANLNLSKVGLIVLSACQTGLGDVEANEGVYGLQRAFKLAGAETLIMSLWEVDDKATSLLMKTFYEDYLNGKAKDVAFRNAINKVRSYKDDNGDTPFASPYYWAAFIMMD